MNITLYDDEKSLPVITGGHIAVYTGKELSPNEENPGTVTEITCTYFIGDQTIIFRKNTESVHLRFEDAVLWAARYAETFDITQIHAVFKLERPIDTRFLRKISQAKFIDNRGLLGRPMKESGVDTEVGITRLMHQRPFPKSMLQRNPILRGKRQKWWSSSSNQRVVSSRQHFTREVI